MEAISHWAHMTRGMGGLLNLLERLAAEKPPITEHYYHEIELARDRLTALLETLKTLKQ